MVRGVTITITTETSIMGTTTSKKRGRKTSCPYRRDAKCPSQILYPLLRQLPADSRKLYLHMTSTFGSKRAEPKNIIGMTFGVTGNSSSFSPGAMWHSVTNRPSSELLGD